MFETDGSNIRERFPLFISDLGNFSFPTDYLQTITHLQDFANKNIYKLKLTNLQQVDTNLDQPN